jgi:hypothetical protein
MMRNGPEHFGTRVLPSSSVAGIDLSFYEAEYCRRICLQQF